MTTRAVPPWRRGSGTQSACLSTGHELTEAIGRFDALLDRSEALLRRAQQATDELGGVGIGLDLYREQAARAPRVRPASRQAPSADVRSRARLQRSSHATIRPGREAAVLARRNGPRRCLSLFGDAISADVTEPGLPGAVATSEQVSGLGSPCGLRASLGAGSDADGLPSSGPIDRRVARAGTRKRRRIADGRGRRGRTRIDGTTFAGDLDAAAAEPEASPGPVGAHGHGSSPRECNSPSAPRRDLALPGAARLPCSQGAEGEVQGERAWPVVVDAQPGRRPCGLLRGLQVLLEEPDAILRALPLLRPHRLEPLRQRAERLFRVDRCQRRDRKKGRLPARDSRGLLSRSAPRRCSSSSSRSCSSSSSRPSEYAPAWRYLPLAGFALVDLLILTAALAHSFSPR